MTPTPVKALVCAALLAALTSTPSDAAKSKNKIISFKDDPHARHMPVYAPVYQEKLYPGPGKYQKRKASDRQVPVRSNPVIVGGRPAACFRFKATVRRYCGCASALKVNLPNHDGRWNLARNWFAFPAAAPGPGMADVRRSHVRIIIASVGDGLFQFYDPNSGQGLTRIHVDRLRGRVVNPHGHRYASAR